MNPQDIVDALHGFWNRANTDQTGQIAQKLQMDALFGPDPGAPQASQGLPGAYMQNQPSPFPPFWENAADKVSLAANFLAPRIPNPIRAYHGSPHNIGPEGFSMERIGTGEGNQTYGHGLYFAENPRVASGYRDPLADDAFRLFMEKNWDQPGLPGHGYEVNLHATPDQFLELEKSPEKQSSYIQEALQKSGIGAPHFGWADNARQAKALGEAGIPGIRYLDQLSRMASDAANAQIIPAQGGFQIQTSGVRSPLFPSREAAEAALAQQRASAPRNPTSNYVVWSPEIIEILRKYGLLGPVAGGSTLIDALHGQGGQGQEQQ